MELSLFFLLVPALKFGAKKADRILLRDDAECKESESTMKWIRLFGLLTLRIGMDSIALDKAGEWL